LGSTGGNYSASDLSWRYPFSRDRAKLSSLLKTLALYRLAFGQPRQAELGEHLLTNISEERIGEIRNKLMLDLSPISYLKTDIELKGYG
jgi:hypothetical protein